MRAVLGAILALQVAQVALAGLAVNRKVPCGDHTCSEYQFCNSFGGICTECSTVCDLTSHNYNHEECYTHCQCKYYLNIYCMAIIMISFKLF
jgi:hypothetical protein